MWSEEQDALLRQWQGILGNKWSQISKHIPGKSGQQCAQRWRHKVNPKISGDHWTEEEDTLLKQLVEVHGKKWARIAKEMPGRTDQQVMGRYKRHLDPNVIRDTWTFEEDLKLCALYKLHRNSWSNISRGLGQRRTSQQCRTRWHYLNSSGFETEHADVVNSINIAEFVYVEEESVQHEVRIDSAEHGQVAQNLNDMAVAPAHIQDSQKRTKRKKISLESEEMSRATNPRSGRPKKRPSYLDAELDSDAVSENSSLPEIPCEYKRPRRVSQRRLNFEGKGFSIEIEDTEENEGVDLHNLEPYLPLAPPPLFQGLRRRTVGYPKENEDEDGILLPMDTGMGQFSSPCPMSKMHFQGFLSPVSKAKIPSASEHNAVDRTPPKPKSKREIKEAEEHLLPMEHEGSKTPLHPALKNAPVSQSPGIAALLDVTSPLKYDAEYRALAGLASPSGFSRNSHLWDTPKTPQKEYVPDFSRGLDVQFHIPHGKENTSVSTTERRFLRQATGLNKTFGPQPPISTHDLNNTVDIIPNESGGKTVDVAIQANLATPKTSYRSFPMVPCSSLTTPYNNVVIRNSGNANAGDFKRFQYVDVHTGLVSHDPRPVEAGSFKQMMDEAQANSGDESDPGTHTSFKTRRDSMASDGAGKIASSRSLTSNTVRVDLLASLYAT